MPTAQCRISQCSHRTKITPNQAHQHHLDDFTPWPRQTWQSRDVLSPLIQALQRQIGKFWMCVFNLMCNQTPLNIAGKIRYGMFSTIHDELCLHSFDLCSWSTPKKIENLFKRECDNRVFYSDVIWIKCICITKCTAKFKMPNIYTYDESHSSTMYTCMLNCKFTSIECECRWVHDVLSEPNVKVCARVYSVFSILNTIEKHATFHLENDNFDDAKSK